ncbi:MAG: carboxylate-amine ligase [Egibacteraceae bacterium]
MPSAPDFTLGVEEEYQVADPTTTALAQSGEAIIDRLAEKDDQGDYAHEIAQSMIETQTGVCETLGEVRDELRARRAAVIRAAADIGRVVAAAGTFPTSDWYEQAFTQAPRYQAMEELQQQVVRELLVCGCHVHVGVADRDKAVAILDRMLPWMPLLLALSSNSPFWHGIDTGYASYRAMMWDRLPSAGMPQQLGSAAEYDALAERLLATEVIVDYGQIYWDGRLSRDHDTLELRVADVCLHVDDAVLQAGLTRALARTCYEEACRELPVVTRRPELVKAAKWRAARFGMTASLLDPFEDRLVDAPALLRRLIDYVGDALAVFGDAEDVLAMAERVLRRGTGAEEQRRAFARRELVTDVAEFVVAETAAG